MVIRYSRTAVIGMVLALSLLLGCARTGPVSAPATNGAAAAKKDMSQEAFDLTFFNPYATISDDYVLKNIETPIKKKFPNVNFRQVRSGKGTTIEELVTAGTVPDLIFGTAPDILKLKQLGLVEDLTPLIKKHNIDLTRMQDGLIDAIKAYSGGQNVFAIPWGLNGTALYYNKGIFDRLGVPYPKDGMTWDQLADVIKKVSGGDASQKVYGFDMNYSNIIGFNQLSLPFVDPKTEKAAVNTDKWQQLFRTLANLYAIQGGEINKRSESDAFTVDKNLALRAGQSMFPLLIESDNKGDDLNWDIVTLPTFKEAPDTGTQPNITILTVSAQSKYKDQVMQMIDGLLSDDVQTAGSMIARQTVMKSKDINAAFGKDSKVMLTKNITAVSRNKAAATPSMTLYDAIAKSVISKKFDETRRGKDANTALREAEEEINKAIDQEKAKTK